MWEGCLSVPGMRGWVEREVIFGLDAGIERKEHLKGLAARIAQHELDDLDGLLFPEYVPGKEVLEPQASMDARNGWAEDWPSAGSFKTASGERSREYFPGS